MPGCDGLDEGRLDLLVLKSACDVALEVDCTEEVLTALVTEIT